MSAKAILFMIALIAVTGLGFWNLDRFEGCTGNSQTFEMEMGRKRWVHCSAARLHYVNQGSGTELEATCDGKQERVMVYKGSGAQLCGMRVRVNDAWQGGPVTKWNTSLTLTWK